MFMPVNARKIVDFVDANKKAGKHASSVKGICCEELQLRVLERYLREQGYDANLLGIPCTTKGNWLDAWIDMRKDGKHILAQTEVKSWSFHGFERGDALPVDVSPARLAEFKIAEWKRYWLESGKRFKAGGLDKVLKRMRTNHTGEIRPIACIWTPIHPLGLDEPMFEVECSGDFEKVWVFSVSSYLRNYMRDQHTDCLDLFLPKSAERISYLAEIFYFNPPRGNPGLRPAA